MKLFFIFDSTYPHYTGGVETWIYNLCERLALKYEITIFNVENYRKDNSMGLFENINPKIRFISVKNLNHLPGVKRLVRSYIAVLNSMVTVRQMQKAIRSEIEKEKNEKHVIVALGTVFAAKTARRIKQEFPETVSIVSSRSLHPEVMNESYPGILKWALNMEKKNLAVADEIWSNGKDTQANLKVKGFESIVIRNGVDVAKLRASVPYNYDEMGLLDEFKIVTIGTVQKIKGYYEIIKALEIIKEKYGVKCHLIGIGKGKIAHFEEYSRKCNVSEQVHLIGEHRDVAAYAKAADMAVCLSGGSGYGMAAIETMITKKPIVAWDSAVYQQLLSNGEDGLLVKPWSVNGLAEGIYYIYNHLDKCAKWGEKTALKAEKFDWANVVADVEARFSQYE